MLSTHTCMEQNVYIYCVHLLLLVVALISIGCSSSKPYLCIAGSGTIILVTYRCEPAGPVHIWELDPGQSLFNDKQTHALGSWSLVTNPVSGLNPPQTRDGLNPPQTISGGEVLDVTVHAAFSINNRVSTVYTDFLCLLDRIIDQCGTKYEISSQIYQTYIIFLMKYLFPNQIICEY